MMKRQIVQELELFWELIGDTMPLQDRIERIARGGYDGSCVDASLIQLLAKICLSGQRAYDIPTLLAEEN